MEKVLTKLQMREKVNNNEELKAKAEELVSKHGKSAVEIATRKANAFQKDCREKDFALMLLTEVEKLTENLAG